MAVLMIPITPNREAVRSVGASCETEVVALVGILSFIQFLPCRRSTGLSRLQCISKSCDPLQRRLFFGRFHRLLHVWLLLSLSDAATFRLNREKAGKGVHEPERRAY